MKNNKIGEMLKKYRKMNALSVGEVVLELQDRYGVSVAEKTVYGWESNQAHPTSDVFVALCDIYRINNITDVFNSNELLGVFKAKTLINKKTLASFMKYACEEARKIAAKGANSACVKDDIVFGWATHYFEEDSIEGILYNEDGSEYKPAPKAKPKTTTSTTTTQKPKPIEPPKPAQFSFFDLMNTQEEKTKEELNVDMETGEIIPAVKEEKPSTSPLYQKYLGYKKKYPQTVVAYRLGDFYECFGDDAKLLADKLELTLTGRDCGLEERVPMVGFPYHAAEKYFFKITEFAPLAIIDNENVSLMPLTNDIDEDDEELTEEEMREFDGDINESIPIEKEKTIFEEDDCMKYIDKKAFPILLELLDGNLDIQ